ncbi:ABC transporter ATP-binding protein [Myroides pelagicus]|uniref:ATP-binding cassette domain-containing protein n=3 Tax=Myroides pelagicus TaxID=270914 RepID=A0A7K1GPK8_9FLAO|nr:ABC transporter ATP-binding protein [Myroides pelagicus]MTH30786.1 ATP-binding cassette domain-containing protein [Myroides pelagicus]
MKQVLLEAKNISFVYPTREILNGVNIAVRQGQFVGIVGSNGCGKSTLLKIIYRVLKAKSGQVTYNGKDIQEYTLKEMARKIAVVGQFNDTTFDTTVLDVVLMGRLPFKARWQSFDQKDYQLALASLEKVDMLRYQDKSLSTLSGGEKQRIFLARALTQQPELIILDEPTNHLDIRFQLEILKIVKSLGIGVLATMHDLSLIANFCDYIYALKDTKMHSSGKPIELLTPENIKTIFGVECKVVQDRDNKLFFSYQ